MKTYKYHKLLYYIKIVRISNILLYCHLNLKPLAAATPHILASVTYIFL